MKDIEHARMMFALAKSDYKALGGMTDPEIFDDNVFGFHVQQAVEKSLKAWLAHLGVQYPKTHDVRLLLNLLREQGADVASFHELIEYNAYAIQFRYESYLENDEPIDRQHCLVMVNNLISHIGKLLNQM